MKDIRKEMGDVKYCRECLSETISEHIETEMVQVGEDYRGNPIGEEKIINAIEYCTNCKGTNIITEKLYTQSEVDEKLKLERKKTLEEVKDRVNELYDRTLKDYPDFSGIYPDEVFSDVNEELNKLSKN